MMFKLRIRTKANCVRGINPYFSTSSHFDNDKKQQKAFKHNRKDAEQT